jgi:uncharacterized protein (DUF486 family)
MNIARSLLLLVLSFVALKVSLSQPLAGFLPSAELIAFAALIWGLAFFMMRNAKPEARIGRQWGFVAASLVTAMVLSGLCFVVPIVKAVTA